MTTNLALAIHLIGVAVWIGGMFFAYMALRPAAVKVLQAPFRLRLWEAVFKNFFPWVWISIAAILLSGYFIIFVIHGGFGSTAVYVHIMHGLGLLMVMIFFHVFFAPFNRMKKAIATESWGLAGDALSQIRLLIAVNLTIGLITIAVATIGRSFL